MSSFEIIRPFSFYEWNFILLLILSRKNDSISINLSILNRVTGVCNGNDTKKDYCQLNIALVEITRVENSIFEAFKKSKIA